jgi:hypothetical protein
MARMRVRHAADQAEFVSLASQLRQVLTDLNAGDIRGNGPKLPAKLGWGVRFEVEGVDLTWSTEKKDDYTRSRSAKSRRRRGCGRAAEDLRQEQAHGGQSAYLQQVAAREAITSTLRTAGESEHVSVLRKRQHSPLNHYPLSTDEHKAVNN